MSVNDLTISSPLPLGERVRVRGTQAAVLLFALLSSAPAAALTLTDPGTEDVVDYAAYGTFEGVGTPAFRYVIKNAAGLAKASGEGIDPAQTVFRDPAYLRLQKEGRLKPSHWQHVNSGDPEADFFKWAGTRNEEPGVRLFFTGKALQAAGQWRHALKAYRAAMLLYPNSFCWSRDHSFAWVIGPAAQDAVVNLLRMRPELGLRLEGASVKVVHDATGEPSKNQVSVTPGRLVPFPAAARRFQRVAGMPVADRRGGRVSVVRYVNGHWGLQVDGKPFLVKGVSYQPTKVGFHIADWDWMTADENNNGLNDPSEEAWMDRDGDDVRDRGEKPLGDFRLIRDMGGNTVRVVTDKPLNVPLLRRLHKKTGVFVILNELLGAYTVHSGAAWADGTDYADPVQRKRMLDAVETLVRQSKDEPWLLAYVLGNENNMEADYTGVNATRTNAASRPEAYASLLNEAAELIHSLDPNHPVGVGNLGVGLVEHYAKLAPALDFIGVNSYPGMDGFGAIPARMKALVDRPVLISEFGCDAYWDGRGPDQATQALYLVNNWQDIHYNSAGAPGEGNILGGVVFEWVDEWWKDTRPDTDKSKQEVHSGFGMAFPDGSGQEEWYGIMTQGAGQSSPFLRRPRQAYKDLQKLWK